MISNDPDVQYRRGHFTVVLRDSVQPVFLANDLTRHGEAEGFMKVAYADFAGPLIAMEPYNCG